MLFRSSEIYDRVGFAAVGRYNEFENLRAAGIRLADLRGYSYDRRDVTGRAVANFYAQTLGAIFTQEQKPFEVEICVAQVGFTGDEDELYRITYDGTVQDEPGIVVMGGQAEALAGGLRTEHRAEASLTEGLHLAVKALASVGGEGGQPRTLTAAQLEVAILDRRRRGRTFRRIAGAALTALLETPPTETVELPADTDAAVVDTGEAPPTPASEPDAAPPDAGTPDAGPSDAGPSDGGTPDAEASDAEASGDQASGAEAPGDQNPDATDS